MSGLLERAVEALESIAASLAGNSLTVTSEPAPEPEKAEEKPKRRRATKAKAAPKNDAPAEEEESISMEELRQLLRAVQAKHNSEVARNLLTQQKVRTIKELPEEKYVLVAAAAKELLEGDE